jgi:ParB family transcriptional regulator, chromosome partitioning protein
MQIPIDSIHPNPDQPRTEFDPGELDALAASIAQHGLLNPIAVEQAGDSFILIDGERRVRAAKLAGHTAIEASVRPASADRLVLALVGNIQRADMNPIDQAQAYRRLVDAGYRIDEIAGMVNLGASQVRKYLALLQMEQPIVELIEQRRLPFETNGLAALGKIQDPERRVQVARAAASAGVSGPGLVRLVNRMGLTRPQPAAPKTPKSMSKVERAEMAGGRWNMIAQLGYKPQEFYIKAAERTCDGCAIYSIASSTNCKDCPGVELLRQLTAVNVNKNGKHKE